MRLFLSTKRERLILYAILSIMISVVIILNLNKFPFGIFPDDFFAYWSSGQLILRGENPYSRINSLTISQEIGFENVGDGLSYFYPPWTLPVFLPFGMATFPISRGIWFVLTLFVLLTCTSMLWELYEGPKNKRWISLLLVLTLSPLLIALVKGQVSPLILLGLTGFLYFENKEQLLIAGAFLILATFKVHILYIFWIALTFWITRYKRWQILWGFLIAIGVTTTLALILDQNVLLEYIQMNLTGLPQYCNNATFSSIICSITGSYKSWYLLIAPIIGLLWLIMFWQRKQDHWDWTQTLPLLIPISLLSAPYVWGHDNLLLLIPVIELFIIIISFRFLRRLNYIILIYLTVNLIFFISHYKLLFNPILFILMPILFLVMYIYSKQKIMRLDQRLTLRKNDFQNF